MIAFRVTVNGKMLATAGIDGGHVLSAIVNSVELEQRSRKARKDIWIHLGGLVSRDRVQDRKHLSWLAGGRKTLAVGDRVLIEIVDVDAPDKPLSERPAGRGSRARVRPRSGRAKRRLR